MGCRMGPEWRTLKDPNDIESERFSCDGVIDERPLREIYLTPFMLAQKASSPQASVSKEQYLLSSRLVLTYEFIVVSMTPTSPKTPSL